MKKLRIFSAIATIALVPSLAMAAESYTVDAVHSAIIFKVKHAQAGYTYGRFRTMTGTIVVDGNKSSVAINVDPNSIYTAHRERDKHLRSPDFLNTKQFPVLSFKSKSMKKRGSNFTVKGHLTLHGKTRPITVRMKQTGKGKNPKGMELIGFEGTFTVKRSDFGMTKMIPMVGDAITITVAIEGIRKS